MQQNHYAIARYRLSFTVTQTLRLPDYAGSLLRGAFGGALRRTACMTGEKDCKSCPLYRTCPYPAIFETPPPEQHQLQQFSQIPNPYVIEPPTWGAHTLHPGETLQFHLVLTGAALQQLPLISYAWQRAGQRLGHGAAQLEQIEQQTPQGYIPVHLNGKALQHNTLVELTTDPISSATLEFVTPLRLQDNGSALGRQRLSESALLMALARRISLIAEQHWQRPLNIDFPAYKASLAQVQGEATLNWRDWTRYSSRQQQTMQLGGVVGTWQLQQLPPEAALLLRLGEWLHVGKNASFGLGQYLLKSTS